MSKFVFIKSRNSFLISFFPYSYSSIAGHWEYQWGEMKQFSQILISPFMMRHHFPQVVLAALKDVAEQASGSSD